MEAIREEVHMESPLAILDMLLLDLPRPGRVAGNIPMLVLGGEVDALMSRREMEKSARALGAECEFFPSMAHNLMQDVGWQQVADRIMAWLREL